MSPTIRAALPSVLALQGTAAGAICPLITPQPALQTGRRFHAVSVAMDFVF